MIFLIYLQNLTSIDPTVLKIVSNKNWQTTNRQTDGNGRPRFSHSSLRSESKKKTLCYPFSPKEKPLQTNISTSWKFYLLHLPRKHTAHFRVPPPSISLILSNSPKLKPVCKQYRRPDLERRPKPSTLQRTSQFLCEALVLKSQPLAIGAKSRKCSKVSGCSAAASRCLRRRPLDTKGDLTLSYDHN